MRTNRLASWGLLIAWWPLALAATTRSAADQPVPGLDRYVRQVMRDWHVPGMAVAVVKDGKVVLARGYGVRELGNAGRVDADTLFDIGSNSKAFTAAALGTLVASGKLGWDTPVVDELGHFRLASAYVTQNLTLRDLLTHRSGYCDPGVWYASDAGDILQRVRHQKPDYGFRTTFCYNNVQYLAASRFIPALTGTSWNDYVATHLFQPLDMTRTVSTEAGVMSSSDVAVPHGMENGKADVLHRYWPHNMDIFAAVGGIWSSANDMSHWLQMLLEDGRYRDRTVLDPAVVAAMETPQIAIQAGTDVGDEIRAWMPGGHFYTYGLGLFVQDWHGHPLVWHAGDIDGMASAVAFVPDAHLGVVVLSNMNQSNARFAVVARVLQSLSGQPLHDIEPALLSRAKKEHAKSDAAERKLADTRVPGSRAPLALKAYAGIYADALDGSAHVEVEHGRLVLLLGNPDFTGDLVPWHGNTFRVTWRYHFYGTDYATFDVDALGKPTRLSLAELSSKFDRVKAPSPDPAHTSK